MSAMAISDGTVQSCTVIKAAGSTAITFKTID